MPGRRQFLRFAAASAAVSGLRATAAPAPTQWHRGDLAHLIPTATQQQFLLKFSFTRRRRHAPRLQIGRRRIVALRNDTAGRFWEVCCDGLAPGTTYDLRLIERDGRPICDWWPLSTLPDQARSPRSLRVLTYTCAGGDEALVQSDGVRIVLPLAVRRRLLARALALQPDVLIANGDHIYYDQESMLHNKPPLVIDAWRSLLDRLGRLQPGLPLLGSANEALLTTVGDRQIAALYGVSLRSIPSFWVNDDHDLFENDEATAAGATLPPTSLRLEAAQTLQRLYYPEFLPAGAETPPLPGSFRDAAGHQRNRAFGSVRIGNLLEVLCYDTKRYAAVDDPAAGMVPASVERWLTERTLDRSSAQLLHCPSTPIGWTAGKWGEWYPDMLDQAGALSVSKPKPYWPAGWWSQHQRLLKALDGQTRRPGAIISGDLHMFSAGSISRSGDLEFANPLHSIVVGPIGTGDPAFPSTHRGTLPRPPLAMHVAEAVGPVEKNGFTMIEVRRDSMHFAFHAWRPPQQEEQIDVLEPFARYEIRGGLT
ncbi:MAG: hypothetical protein R3E77_14860 [Steroidobacteraceae bacterium]